MNSKSLKQKLVRFFKGKQGGAVPTAIKVLTAVVCGAVIMMGLYGVITGVVLPASSDKVNSMFSYEAEGGSGGAGGGGGYGGGTGDPTPVYEMLDGNGQTINTSIATPLVFRSSAPYNVFQSVKVNDEVVDSSNYTVTEGSTIITFNSAYTTSLSGGEYDIEIVSADGSASGVFNITDSKIIPEGHIYSSNATGELIGDGATVLFPETISDQTTYSDGCYRFAWQGGSWNIELIAEKNRTEYPAIPSHILGYPITMLNDTFVDCTEMTVAPVIPDTVTMMQGTFNRCTSLKKAPVIPSSVNFMVGTFCDCAALSGDLVINANNLNVTEACLQGTVKPIVLKGSYPQLAQIAAQYNNVTVAE